MVAQSVTVDFDGIRPMIRRFMNHPGFITAKKTFHLADYPYFEPFLGYNKYPILRTSDRLGVFPCSDFETCLWLLVILFYLRFPLFQKKRYKTFQSILISVFFVATGMPPASLLKMWDSEIIFLNMKGAFFSVVEGRYEPQLFIFF